MAEAIYILRLKTNEDIICFLENYGHDELVVRDPMCFFTREDGKSGKRFISLESWLPSHLMKSNEVLIKESEVLFKAEASTEFNEYYQNYLLATEATRKLISTGSNTSSSNDDELTPDDMNILLEMVGPGGNNQIH